MKNFLKDKIIEIRLRKYVGDDLPLSPSEIVYYEGIRKGCEIAQNDVASKLLDIRRLSVDDIASCSGLTKRQVKRIAKRNNSK